MDGAGNLKRDGVNNLSRKAHELLSRGALLPLSRWQRMARASRRPAMRAFYAGLRFRREAAAWGEERRREWLLGRLRFAVRRAEGETNYYRELFRRVGFDPRADVSFAEFARLPVLEREDVRRAHRALVSTAVAADQFRRDATGGTSGEPTVVWLGPEEQGWRESALEYFMGRIGAPTGVPTGFLWGHHLDPVTRSSRRERYHDFEANVRWFDCFRMSPATLEFYHQEFERWRPACIIAYASALASLAEHAAERGHRPHYPARGFVTGAEKLLPSQREIVERVFRRPVHERYGSRDAGLMGFQVNPSRTLDYEIDWASILVEPETEARESAILITKLRADGMPMLRYRVGDVGVFPEGSRAGHPAFALHEVVGRDLDRLWMPDGRWIHGAQIPHLMKDQPVREFMLTQRADYSVEVQVVAKRGFGEDARENILNMMTANLPGLSVSVVSVEEIPRTKANKLRPVVSEIRPPGRGGESS